MTGKTFGAVLSTVIALAASRGYSFVNPVGKGQSPDPCVTWDAATGYYYLLFTHGKNVEIRRARTIESLRDGECFVAYRSSPTDGIYGHIWAPEMHRAPSGKWYVYTSGSVVPDSPWGQKRLFVLESKTSDPFDGFVFRGKPDKDLFAIDPTILRCADGRWVMCYSQIIRNRGQVLVLREMTDPVTFGPRRAEIAEAVFDWELKHHKINEGAFFIRSPDGRRLFCVYSGNGCWNDEYALGVIEFTGKDLFDPKSWKKHPGRLLYKGNGAFGPGHASFFRSPDGTELWCVYHAFLKSNPSRKPIPRYLNFQRVSFDETGFPVMGEAVGSAPQRPPSGENPVNDERKENP